MNTFSALLFGALCTLSTHGIADSKDYGEGLQNLSDSTLLKNADGSHDHWRGIGRLSNGYCTATLLDTRDASATGPSPAYVLTAGHCIGLTNGNIVTDSPTGGVMQFNFFSDTASINYTVKKVAWRSMQGVDIAIVELNVSLQKLIEDGIHPLKLAAQKPADGTDVLIVSAPFGFFNQNTFMQTLRMAACTLQPANEIVEGSWVWRDSVMTRCKDIAGGSSGGPILDRQTNEIVAVVGTGNFDKGLQPCHQDAPCTPVDGVYTAIQGNVYGNPTSFLNGCFEQGRLVSQGAFSCPLYPVFTVVSADSDRPTRYQKIIRREDGTLETPTWAYRFFIDTQFYRHATVRTAKSCEDPRNYAGAVTAEGAFIDDKIGNEPGYYFLCIVGVDSPDQRPSTGLMRNALSLPAEILAGTSPTKPALYFWGDRKSVV